MCSHQFSESAIRSSAMSLPTPSTWPCTMCPPKRCPHPLPGRQVGTKRSRLDVDGGKADSAYGHAVASFQLLRRMLGCYRDAAIFTALFNAGYLPDLFNNASEHEGLRGDPNIINPRPGG